MVYRLILKTNMLSRFHIQENELNGWTGYSENDVRVELLELSQTQAPCTVVNSVCVHCY